jgi:Protein of unknown function (DUF1194)
MSRRTLLSLVALGSLALSAPTQAAPISLELAIVIDSSGSISASDFATHANFGALKTAIQNMSQIGSTTAIGDAIAKAATDLLTPAIDSLRQIIDVSTDGVSNTGQNDVTAAANAVAAGIEQVNCLGVGGAANCNFIAGTGAFSINAANFAAFEAALTTKLAREIGVPEPS